jgi:predicted nucleic acid-binding protein
MQLAGLGSLLIFELALLGSISLAKRRCCRIQETAVQGARFRHERDWGMEDALIYATSVREGAKVLTGETHFKGLKETIFLEID